MGRDPHGREDVRTSQELTGVRAKLGCHWAHGFRKRDQLIWRKGWCYSDTVQTRKKVMCEGTASWIRRGRLREDAGHAQQRWRSGTAGGSSLSPEERRKDHTQVLVQPWKGLSSHLPIYPAAYPSVCHLSYGSLHAHCIPGTTPPSLTASFTPATSKVSRETEEHGDCSY